MLLWLGQSAHALALWMEQIARPFLVLAITDGSAAHVGGVLAVRTLPQLFFGVFAGVMSDWFDRRTILVVTKISVLFISIIFAGLLVLNQMQLWHVYVFQFIRGTFMAFDQPARQSMIASIVPEEEMVGGVALMSATQNVMRIVGSAAGGFAIGFLGMTGAFVAVAVIYVGAVISTWMLDVPTHEKPAGSGARAMANGVLAQEIAPATVPGASSTCATPTPTSRWWRTCSTGPARSWRAASWRRLPGRRRDRICNLWRPLHVRIGRWTGAGRGYVRQPGGCGPRAWRCWRSWRAVSGASSWSRWPPRR